MKMVTIKTEYIRLQDLLKLANAVGSGGEAKERIQSGEAQVNGEVCTQRGKKLRSGDQVIFAGQQYEVCNAD
jgi:ribosome-associated protein